MLAATARFLVAALTLAGPAWAQEVEVEVDLQPDPGDSPTNLFLIGFARDQTDDSRIQGSQPLAVIPLGLWLRKWPFHRRLTLQDGLYYQAVYGYEDQPQPHDPYSEMVYFEGQEGPLRFVIPWTPRYNGLSEGDVKGRPVEVLINMGSLSWDGAEILLMAMATESIRDGRPRRDAQPIEVLQLQGRHYGTVFRVSVPLLANRHYIPVLRNPKGGLMQDIQGIPVLYEGGPSLILAFEQEEIRPARSEEDLPLVGEAVGTEPWSEGTEEEDSSWALLALVGGSLSVLAIVIGLRSRRDPS